MTQSRLPRPVQFNENSILPRAASGKAISNENPSFVAAAMALRSAHPRNFRSEAQILFQRHRHLRYDRRLPAAVSLIIVSASLTDPIADLRRIRPSRLYGIGSDMARLAPCCGVLRRSQNWPRHDFHSRSLRKVRLVRLPVRDAGYRRLASTTLHDTLYVTRGLS
jgi:hypothetical protein